MKTLKHIWRYWTNSMYRSYVDLQMTQQALDAHVNMMKDQMRRASLPPLIVEVMDRENISAEYAAKLVAIRMR